MSALVQIGHVQIGGASNQVGVFDGQNMQIAWDSHSPGVSALGIMMGRYNATSCMHASVLIQTAVGQPIVDNDIKLNASPAATIL